MIFPSRRFTLGLGVAAVGGVAVWSSFNDREPLDSAQAGSVGRRISVHRGAAGPIKPMSLASSRAARPERAGAVADTASATPGAAERSTPADRVVAFQPTREELEFRALMVEQQANKQLKSLLGVLHLTEDQQDRLFSTLARRSDYYHPALRFQGAAGGDIPAASPATPVTPMPPDDLTLTSPETEDSTDDPIVAELEPDQVEVYERYRSERDSFWAGVLSDIEQKLNTNGR